jgi:hypothetical protein
MKVENERRENLSRMLVLGYMTPFAFLRSTLPAEVKRCGMANVFYLKNLSSETFVKKIASLSSISKH